MRFPLTVLLVSTALLLSALPVSAQDAEPKPTPKPGDAPAPPGEAPDAAPGDAKPEASAATITLSPEESTAEALFPVTGSTRLVYQLKVIRDAPEDSAESEPEVTTHTLDVVRGETAQVGGKPHNILEWRVDGETRQKEFYRLEDGRLVVSRRVFGPKEHAKVCDIDAPQIVLPKELKVNQAWTWEGKVGKIPGTNTMKVLRQEELKIGELSYRTAVVEMRYQGEDGSTGTSLRWYAPKIGIVKELLEVKTQAETLRTEVILERIDRPADGD